MTPTHNLTHSHYLNPQNTTHAHRYIYSSFHHSVIKTSFRFLFSFYWLFPLWVLRAHLQTRVDGEGSSCGVHARHVLRVVDVLQAQLLPVVPVAVVDVLADQRVWLHGVVLVHLPNSRTMQCYPVRHSTIRHRFQF